MTPLKQHFLALVLFCWIIPPGKILAQHPRSVVPDSLDGWFIPFDSATYNVNKHSPSCMHFMKDGKYEVFGVADKKKMWMYKGTWRKSNDTIYYFYDWSFDQTIRAKYLATLIESVPFGDTLVFSNGKYHYADPHAGIRPFVLIKIDWNGKNAPVSEAVGKIKSYYKKEITNPAVMNEKRMKGIYSWQGDAGQTTLKLKGSGKYMMYRGEMKMTQWQKGKWKVTGDTLTLHVSYARMYYVQDAVPLREYKLLMNGNGLMLLANQDVTIERHLYFMHRKFYRIFRHRFHRSLNG